MKLTIDQWRLLFLTIIGLLIWCGCQTTPGSPRTTAVIPDSSKPVLNPYPSVVHDVEEPQETEDVPPINNLVENPSGIVFAAPEPDPAPASYRKYKKGIRKIKPRDMSSDEWVATGDK